MGLEFEAKKVYSVSAYSFVIFNDVVDIVNYNRKIKENIISAWKTSNFSKI